MRSASVKGAMALAMSMAAPTIGYAAADAAKVYFLLPNSTTIRFTTRDAPLYVAALKKLAPNAQVIVQNGEGDQARQQRLVEDAVSQGAKVIVLTASDSNLAAGSLDAAHKAGVPVILYDMMRSAARRRSRSYSIRSLWEKRKGSARLISSTL